MERALPRPKDKKEQAQGVQFIQNIQVCCKKIKITGSCKIQNIAPAAATAPSDSNNNKYSDTEDESDYDGDETDNDDEEDLAFEETDIAVHGSNGLLSFVHRHAASSLRLRSHDPVARHDRRDADLEKNANDLPSYEDPFTLSMSSTDEDEEDEASNPSSCAPFISRSISFRSIGSGSATVNNNNAPHASTCIMCEDADAPPTTKAIDTGIGLTYSGKKKNSAKKSSCHKSSVSKNSWFLFQNVGSNRRKADFSKVEASPSSGSERSDYGLFDDINEEYDDDDDHNNNADNGAEVSLSSSCEEASDEIHIRLNSKDEIHVSPCQCALTLMGMHSSTSSTFNLKAPARTTTGASGKPPLPPLASPKSSEMFNNFPLDEPFELSKSSSFDKHPLLQNSKGESHSIGNRRRILTEDDHTLIIPHRKTPSGGASSFHMLGYHEITVIRCEYGDEANSSHDIFPWSVLTIRCSTHDEMDKIIGTLQRASKGIKVVPFSYDVKKRAKRAMKRRRGGSSPKGSPVLSSSKYQKWNNRDSCEYCSSLFTILTRRHHCRKCHRSVCDDCSCLLFISGGNRKRLCNKCYQDGISKKTSSLSRLRARNKRDVAFSGKVHSACGPLGVGLFGKLPHWQNWCTYDASKRPAIGRLSVEIMQALALPCADEVTGKSDPYVRATLTGYGYTRDIFIKEWKAQSRYSLDSSFCSGTLSPVWRGTGLKGGEVLTLPVISTAGAILRLEILHYDVFTNGFGRSHANDRVLGIVEIPLSDFPNANLRNRNDVEYDGFIDRWYHVNITSPEKGLKIVQKIPLATPIDDPRQSPDLSSNGQKSPRNNFRKAMDSLDEIGKRVNGLCRAPILWTVTALGIDLYPWYTPSVDEYKSKASIHVRIKLNVSTSGDLLCHCWEPPIIQREKPPFEPQITLSHLKVISEKLQPYQKRLKFCEDIVRWRQPVKTCIIGYLALAFHIYFIHYFVLFLHLYILAFLIVQLSLFSGKDKAGDMIDVDDLAKLPTPAINYDKATGTALHRKNLGEMKVNSPSLQDLSNKACVVKVGDDLERVQCMPEQPQKEEPSQQLSTAVRWLIKFVANNRGLESIQFKAGLVARDLTVLNSLWDGSNIYRMEATILYFFISLIVHLNVRQWRLLWIIGSSLSYFSCSPFFVQNVLGFWRGISKISLRQHLHKIEVTKNGLKG